jgi:uncharacterized protein YndB with AHSA1/START domain
MSATDRTSIEVEHRYDAPAERVCDAWLDPGVARLFLFATREGEMLRAETDPRVGGRFTFVDRRPEMGEVEHVGEYLEIDRPRRLVFSFAVPAFSPDPTLVTIEIAPEGEGCRLVLTQKDVLPDHAERSREGWRRILDGLSPALDGVKAAGWS